MYIIGCYILIHFSTINLAAYQSIQLINLFYYNSVLHQENQRLYGIDWNGPVPTNREDYVHVEVPNVNIAMSKEQKLQLKPVVEPLADSGSYGIDLYMKVQSCLVEMGINQE